MLKRLTQALVAFIIAFAATMPAGARAMPMQAMAMQPGQTGAGRPCQQCPDHPSQSPGSGKMVLCPMLVCAGPVLGLSAMNAIGNRVERRVAYPAALSARLAGATPAPDPFPPRPIVLL